MPSPLDTLLGREDLSADMMRSEVGRLMDGEMSPASIAALLIALRMKGESVGEIVGAAEAMRDRVTPIIVSDAAFQSRLLDTCGTGGDSLHTFNISTATAIVLAACGLPIAKHGNRSVSSSSGSADVLEALGVRIDLSPEQVARCIEEVGIGFCFAPLFHGAMKHAAPVRRELGVRTIFNLLGPLTNPASAPHQLLGVSNDQHAELIAQALARLERERAVVVCGNGELDEVALWGTTHAFLVTPSGVTQQEWTAETFGLEPVDVADLKVSSPDESAAVIRSILDRQTGSAFRIVVANAAAGLYAAGAETDLKAAAARATDAIMSGTANSVVENLSEWTNAVS